MRLDHLLSRETGTARAVRIPRSSIRRSESGSGCKKQEPENMSTAKNETDRTFFNKLCIVFRDHASEYLVERCGGLAQLVERLLCKQEVSGSTPLISTNEG